MKKYISILFIVFIIHISCTPTKSDKQLKIEHFQSEMKRINDSSLYYFDKGIKLLEEGVHPNVISARINGKLTYYKTEINIRSRGFKTIAKKLNLSEKEYDKVFEELGEIFQSSREKFKYLTENGVKIN
ncbi:hypothetical protein [uncultured Kordia sp.]|uniref:hypothetical protein n=1 Tax=uncultured Kordia sp. TaxID=507699 RepID=UPI00262F2EB9|nr:hypothetical protein [uncultured Kordia sp.]